MKAPRLVIGAPSSGCGKSTLTAGLMASCARRGAVQGFKVGPDYIDPMYHSLACGRPAYNLDAWMTSPHYVIRSFRRAMRGAVLGIVEGVMGLFDGFGGRTEEGSTAQVAKLLDAPLVLVLDTAKMARSAAAIALGCRTYDPDLNLAGVICNRVGSPAHAAMLREAIEGAGIRVLGCVPRLEDLRLPERHLGLYTAVEREPETRRFLDAAADAVEAYVDLTALREIADSAPPFEEEDLPPDAAMPGDVRIGIAYDEAFCFYYQDNFDLLRSAGAELIFFSPRAGEGLPDDLEGLYLGGGYPELYASRIASNRAFLDGLRRAYATDMPIYAECGGLMVLSEAIVDMEGSEHVMAGLLPGRTLCGKSLHMGYRFVRSVRHSLLLKAGEETRGHEFHYSTWEGEGVAEHAPYAVRGSRDENTRPEGFCRGSLTASYVHLHFGSSPHLADRFVEACRAWRRAGKDRP